MKAMVYESPGEGFPYLAVVFKPDGDVFIARPVPDRQAGEALIIEVFSELSDRSETSSDWRAAI